LSAHTLTDTVETDIVEIGSLSRFILDDVVEEVYPRARIAQAPETAV
jgi:alkaline phosphatase D